MIYKERYKVELEDIGRENKIDNKRIVTIMEDIAGSHSDKVGLGVSASAINKKAWVLLDWKIKILKRPAYNEYIDASTWSRKSDRLCAFRDFELYDQNGELCAIGTSRWLYMDLVRRRPIILDNKMNDIYGTETEKNVFDEEIKKIELPDLDNLPDNIMVTEKPYLIQRRDIDINGHLHNVSYLEAALEAVPEDIYKNVDFNYIRIEYKKEIMQNDNIKIKCLTDNNYNCLVIFETDNKMNAVVELSNRDGTAASLGPSGDYAAFAAAIGDEFSNVDGNSLLIRNTALTQATNGKYLGITTAYASEITNVDAQQQLEKGSMSSNLLVLDNVLVTRDESFTNTNIRLGAVHLLNQHRHKDQMSDVDLNDNRVFLRDSDITAYSIYAAMVEAGVQTYQTIDASGNQIVIDGSDIKLGGKWGEAVSQGNPAIATTVKTSNATSNELFLNNSTITLNYAGVADDSQKTTILSSVYGATAANNNTTVLTDVDILVNGTPAQTDEGQLQSVLIAGASATTVGFSNATTANAANGNSLWTGALKLRTTSMTKIT